MKIPTNLYETNAGGDANLNLMNEVAQALSNYLRYMPVSASALPSLIRDVGRQMTPQSPNQILTSTKEPKRRRQEFPKQVSVLTAKSVIRDDQADASRAPVAEDAIDLDKIQITRLPARRARGL